MILKKNIVSIIDQYIQPAVAADGGSIVFKSFKDGVVYVILKELVVVVPHQRLRLSKE